MENPVMLPQLGTSILKKQGLEKNNPRWFASAGIVGNIRMIPYFLAAF
ncbi:MAG: hypothetical protein FWD77_07025 [Betaproteobacteria bacterium]|nr:hypothetical protein [Betaproteobacteria bacterium]